MLKPYFVHYDTVYGFRRVVIAWGVVPLLAIEQARQSDSEWTRVLHWEPVQTDVPVLIKESVK